MAEDSAAASVMALSLPSEGPRFANSVETPSRSPISLLSLLFKSLKYKTEIMFSKKCFPHRIPLPVVHFQVALFVSWRVPSTNNHGDTVLLSSSYSMIIIIVIIIIIVVVVVPLFLRIAVVVTKAGGKLLAGGKPFLKTTEGAIPRARNYY